MDLSIAPNAYQKIKILQDNIKTEDKIISDIIILIHSNCNIIYKNINFYKKYTQDIYLLLDIPTLTKDIPTLTKDIPTLTEDIYITSGITQNTLTILHKMMFASYAEKIKNENALSEYMVNKNIRQNYIDSILSSKSLESYRCMICYEFSPIVNINFSCNRIDITRGKPLCMPSCCLKCAMDLCNLTGKSKNRVL